MTPLCWSIVCRSSVGSNDLTENARAAIADGGIYRIADRQKGAERGTKKDIEFVEHKLERSYAVDANANDS